MRFSFLAWSVVQLPCRAVSQVSGSQSTRTASSSGSSTSAYSKPGLFGSGLRPVSVTIRLQRNFFATSSSAPFQSLGFEFGYSVLITKTSRGRMRSPIALSIWSTSEARLTRIPIVKRATGPPLDGTRCGAMFGRQSAVSEEPPQAASSSAAAEAAASAVHP